MKAVFVHTHQFACLDSGVFSLGQFPRSAWERYLAHFDHLDVIARKKPTTDDLDASRYNRSNRPDVSFHLIEGRRGSVLDRFHVLRAARQKLNSVLPSANAAILRNSPMARQAARLCERHDVPWAMEVVGDVWDALWNYGRLSAKLYAPLAEWHSQYWIHRAPFALYVTRRTLQEKYPCEGHTVGVSDVVIPEPDEAVLQSRLKKEEQSEKNPTPLTFGFVGTIENETKGLEPAFRAFERAAPNLPDFEFRILGPGDPEPWEQRAEQKELGDKIHFDGAVPGGDPVLEWLDGIDVYVHPSLQDGLPRSLIEAMSRGCPALASRAGGIPELLPASVTHEPGDWKQLAEHIQALAPRADWRLRHARQNFETAKNYSREKLEKERSEFWGKFAEYARKKSVS